MKVHDALHCQVSLASRSFTWSGLKTSTQSSSCSLDGPTSSRHDTGSVLPTYGQRLFCAGPQWSDGTVDRVGCAMTTTTLKQTRKPLANAKVSAQQPWYIGHNSLNRPHLGTPNSINVISRSLNEKYFLYATIPSLTMHVYLHCFNRCCLPRMRNSAKFRENLNLQQSAVQGHPRSSTVVPIESVYATSHQSVIITLVISCTGFCVCSEATYWLKIAYFSYRRKSTPLIRRHRSLCSIWNFAVKLTTRKLESLGYSVQSVVKVA